MKRRRFLRTVGGGVIAAATVSTLAGCSRALPPEAIAHLGAAYCPEERGIFASLTTEENLRLAAYAFSDTRYPDEAFVYLKRAVEQATPDDPLVVQAFSQLRSAGREEWVRQLTHKED